MLSLIASNGLDGGAQLASDDSAFLVGIQRSGETMTPLRDIVGITDFHHRLPRFVCVYVSVCMYLCVRLFIYVRAYVHTCPRVNTHCVSGTVCVFVGWLCACLFVFVCVYVCVCVRVCVCLNMTGDADTKHTRQSPPC